MRRGESLIVFESPCASFSSAPLRGKKLQIIMPPSLRIFPIKHQEDSLLPLNRMERRIILLIMVIDVYTFFIAQVEVLVNLDSNLWPDDAYKIIA